MRGKINLTVAMHNLGCKVNSYEADAMLHEMELAGFRPVSWEEKADVYIINTCSVTNIADRKSRQMLHRARAKNPEAVVVAVGCYVQARAEELKSDTAVDLLIGNNIKGSVAREVLRYLEEKETQNNTQKSVYSDCAVPTESGAAERRTEQSQTIQGQAEQSQTIQSKTEQRQAEQGQAIQRQTEQSISEAETGGAQPEGRTADGTAEAEMNASGSDSRVLVEDLTAQQAYDTLYAPAPHGRVRAFVKVQDGCNQFCAYCIIPHLRGRIRSRAQTDTLRELEALAQNGCREVVLTGIHLSSYGLDWADSSYEQNLRRGGEAEALMQLIEAAAAVPGIERIRLGSLEPRIVTEQFAVRMSRVGKLCPHFHLSLQSGCDKTLKAMNRHYTTGDFREACARLRASFPNVAITTDVIAGFPGETEADFEESYRFVEEIGFYELHVFKFSRRAGTPADKMPMQLSEQEKGARSERLLALDKRQSAAFREHFLGKKARVLVEEQVSVNGQSCWSGYSPEYVKFLIPCEKAGEAVTISSIIEVEGIEICETCILANPIHLV